MFRVRWSQDQIARVHREAVSLKYTVRTLVANGERFVYFESTSNPYIMVRIPMERAYGGHLISETTDGFDDFPRGSIVFPYSTID